MNWFFSFFQELELQDYSIEQFRCILISDFINLNLGIIYLKLSGII